MVWKGLGLMGGAARGCFWQKFGRMVVEGCGKGVEWIFGVIYECERW